MTEYWKSQEKTFCDMCKCWLTDNKSSVDFHKNGKRHKENVEKRLKEIMRKTKADEKKDKKFEHEMQRIERAALAACEKDSEHLDTSIPQNLQKPSSSSSVDKGKGDSDDSSESSNQPKILHRKDKKKSSNESSSSSSSITSSSIITSGTVGAWQPVTEPTYVDLELPTSSRERFEYEAKPREKRKIKFVEKTVDSVTPTVSSSSLNSWMKVEPQVEFKKRKFTKNNMRQRQDD